MLPNPNTQSMETHLTLFLPRNVRSIGLTHLGFLGAWFLLSASAAFGQSFTSSSLDSAGGSTAGAAQASPATMTAFHDGANVLPLEIGAIFQGGKGITDNRDGFKFLMAGFHVGKVLTYDHGHGLLRGNFEYAVEVFPYWESFTPTFQRANCVATADPSTISCSPLYTVGGTYHGVTVTPIILAVELQRFGQVRSLGSGRGWACFGRTISTPRLAACR